MKTAGKIIAAAFCVSLAAAAQSQDLAALQARIDKLTLEVQRTQDAQRIQNLMSTLTYMNEAGRFEDIVGLFAQKTPGVTAEIGARGVYEGVAGVRKTILDSGKLIEQQHAAGMKKAFPDISFSSPRAGMQENWVISSPIVEVAGDGKTAKGLWSGPSAQTQFNDTAGKPVAYWMWMKFAVDFVKEDGEWKLWHYHLLPIFRTSFDKSWADAPARPPPGGRDPHAGLPTADRPTTEMYRPYGPQNAPAYVPRPPVPYASFEQTFSY